MVMVVLMDMMMMMLARLIKGPKVNKMFFTFLMNLFFCSVSSVFTSLGQPPSLGSPSSPLS